MVDRAISGDPSLTAGQIAGGDLIAVIDISEPADVDKNKSITFTVLDTYLQGSLLHNSFSDYDANEHIDWTNATEDFLTTGLVTVDDLVLTGISGDITKDAETGDLSLSGGSTVLLGANMSLHGDDHAVTPYDMFWSAATATKLHYDHSTNLWDFQAVDVQIGTVKIGAAINGIHRTVSDDLLRLSGSDLITNGANMRLYGHTHSSKAYDIDFYAGAASAVLEFDYSENLWDFGSSAITTTGDITSGGFYSTSAQGIYRNVNTDFLALSGGDGGGAGSGANIHLFGSAEASTPYDMNFRAGSTSLLYWDNSASLWDFQANAILTTGPLTCGLFTSVGLDDNCTEKRFDFSDLSLSVGSSVAATAYTIDKRQNTGILAISGGSSSVSGGSIFLYGGAHGSQASDIEFYGNGGKELQYDHSASRWNFQANNIQTTGWFQGGYMAFNDNRGLYRSTNAASILIQGGSNGTSGAWKMYGGTHSSQAYDVEYVSGATVEFHFDYSANLWDFQLNTVAIEQKRINPTPAADHTASGTIASMELGATVVFGELLHIDTDGQLIKSDADAIATMPVFAMALEAGDATDFIDVLLHGFVRDDSWLWSVGVALYASGTPGDATPTAPSGAGDIVQVVGRATHNDRMYFNPSMDWIEL